MNTKKRNKTAKNLYILFVYIACFYDKIMNITTPGLNNGGTVSENFSKIYIDLKGDGKELQTQPKPKPKSKIRIKSKSQGRFKLDYDKEKGHQVQSKTTNLLTIVKQIKNIQLPQRFVHERNLKKSIFLKQDIRASSNHPQIVFLKQLVKKRREIPQEPHNASDRSQSTVKVLEQERERQSNDQQRKSKQLKHYSSSQKNENSTSVNDWERKIDEYQYYDSVVKDLLESMSKRKSTKPARPMISPSKYNQAKQKLLNKFQFEQLESGLCNFKSVIKIQPRKDMIFRMSDFMADRVYEKKILSYLKFLYKVNCSNCIYTDLSLSSPSKSYKVKVGGGNNSELIKTLIKRRFWLQIDNNLQIEDKESKISFIWTQNTIQQVFRIQKSNGKNKTPVRKLEENEKIMRRLKKSKKVEKKRQSFFSNEKILNPLEIEQIQNFFFASSNGIVPVYSRIQPEIVSNHIPSNFIIGSKKALFFVLHWYYENIKKIDPFTYLPKTYNIRSGDVNSLAFQKFVKNQSEKPDSVWIVKPGENTNRGNGINVASFNEVNKLIRRKQLHKNGEQKTYIIQKYLKPFLYNGRKFDIRHYLLITSTQGNIKAYWYKEGYIRTSSQKYDLEDLGNQYIHLTNDAIQKKSSLYGKYEPGNKLSYTNFQRYLDQTYPQKKYSFEAQILKKMKEITTDLIHASFSYLDPERKNYNFQLYGMDFMINNKFQPYIIEVNANPCLEISCPVLERIIPTLVQHTFRLALDPLFPPVDHFPVNCRYQLSDRILEKLKYELIFDEKFDGEEVRQKIESCESKFTLNNKNMEADEEIFQDDGENEQNFEID